MNIGGGGGGSGASTPSEKPAATTIKLNIGGSKSGAATPPQQLADSGKPVLGSVPEGSTTVSKKALNFTAEKAKNDADAIAAEHARLADEETLKDLYGERERQEDANGR